uniref:GP3 protein n=1 Tax=Mikumi yellow baboon virus 1 TaxID=1546177 RepID=A0A089G1F1_9NIDO|nr:GP3 protein [Mikumi yellow baboon virus 1]
MLKTPLSNCRAHLSQFLCPPTQLLLHTLVTCSICILLGAGGAASSDNVQSCIFSNTSNHVLVSLSPYHQELNLTNDRTDITDALCHLCNCTSSPCSCSQVSSDLVWVTTHPLQHLLLLLTLLLPNQFHLRRPRTAHATRAAGRAAT